MPGMKQRSPLETDEPAQGLGVCRPQTERVAVRGEVVGKLFAIASMGANAPDTMFPMVLDGGPPYDVTDHVKNSKCRWHLIPAKKTISF